MALTTVLLGTMASALVLSSRAIPGANDPAVLRIEGHAVVEQIANDLWCAKSFSNRTPKTVTFTVADRTSDLDADPDVLTYEWSGLPGDPLYRIKDGEPARVLAEDVYDFQITYGIATTGTTTMAETLSWSAVQTLVSFTGWSGLTPQAESFGLGPASLASQYFTYTPPAGTSAVEITRAWAMLQKGFNGTGSAIAEIRRSANDGTLNPAGTSLGTPSARAAGTLTTAFNWTDFPFTDVIVTDFSRSDFCLVLSAANLNDANLQVYFNRNAPADGMAHTWTGDGGASWSPAFKDIHKRDVPFVIEGRCQTLTTSEVTTNRYFVTSVRIALQLGQHKTAWTETAVEILNQPEVASP